MELRQLRYFLGIVEHANFNRAALALHVTQPALSKSMRALEDELGVELLERGANGVVPTPYGRILLGAARVATGEIRRAVEEIDALAARGTGRLIVGGGVVLRHVVPRVCERLDAPGEPLEIVVVEGLRAPLLQALARGDIDVALCPSGGTGTLAEDLVQEPLLRDRVRVVAHRDHPLCGRDRVAFADLAPFGWVVPAAAEQERQELARAMAAAGAGAPRIAFETASTALMARLLAHRPLLSYLPSLLLQDDPGFGELRALALEHEWPSREVSLVYRQASTQRAGVARFLDAVRAVARERPGTP